MRTRTLNNESRASNPGGITLSHDRLRCLRPDLYGGVGFFMAVLRWLTNEVPQKTYLREHLMHGDSRAAVVMSINPVLIAAYTDEFDCIALLQFEPWVAKTFRLQSGARLLTVNTYKSYKTHDPDLDWGRGAASQWSGFHPLIADFLTDDTAALAGGKQRITEAEWRRAHELGVAYIIAHPGIARDGRPMFAAEPAALS